MNVHIFRLIFNFGANYKHGTETIYLSLTGNRFISDDIPYGTE